jgi:hypothetical protein
MKKWFDVIIRLIYYKFFNSKKIDFNASYYSESKEKWIREGSPIPAPEAVKRSIIIEYYNKFKCNIFIETGTYKGGTIEVMSNLFKNLYTIELSKMLYLTSKERLKALKNIKFLNGDSIAMLPKVLNEVDQQAIIWLDGHYSGGITAKGISECPVFGELEAIHKFGKDLKHIILVDDIRCFDGKRDYPMVEDVIKKIKYIDQNYQIEIKDDILRAVVL